MEDLVSMCESRCRKACNLRSAAEDSEETCHSGSSGGRARRYRKRGAPKPAAGDPRAMDTDPSPVRLWDSEGHSEGYRTAYEQPSESEETARPPTRANTDPEPSLEHDAEALERPARARRAPVAWHTEPTRDSMGDTPMAEESKAPRTAGCAGSGGKHAECHCEHVSFLMGKYPKMGMDAIVHRLDSLDNAKDVLPGHWKRRVEDEEKKRAKKRVAVRIMAAEDTHAGIMEFFRRNLGEPNRMLGLKNAVYVEVFGDTMGQRLLRLNNVEWRRGEQLRMQVIFACMSLDEIVKYITGELKLNAKNEAHVQDRHGHGQRGHREDGHHREIQEDTANSAEDGSGSGQDNWSREDHEEAHFFAFVAHNVREHGQDRSRWNRVGPKKSREPRRIGNPPLSFREYRSQHDGCWVCCGKGNNHAHDHRQCKVYEADKKAYFAAHPEKKPEEQRIDDSKAKGGDGGKAQGKGQGIGGGRGYGGGPGQDRRVTSIEEVAEDMLRTLEELKAQQRGGQSPRGSQPEGAAGSQV